MECRTGRPRLLVCGGLLTGRALGPGGPGRTGPGRSVGGRCRLGVLGPRGQRRRGYETASQQGNTKLLPNHAISFVTILPILAGIGTLRWAGPDNQKVERHPNYAQ